MQEILERAAKVKLVIFDVDGVLTDGSLFYGDDGQEYKAFNSRDGHGMKMLQGSGVKVGIITGRSSSVVTHRMENLGVTDVYQGQLDKVPAFERMIAELGVEPAEVAYVGDDVVDLPVMRRVGFAIAVADAHELVKRYAHWTTSRGGGRGAAREACELIMKARGVLDEALGRYLR